MSGQIDVLAVLDEFALYVRNVSSRHALQWDILEARAFATGDVGPDYIAMACSALTESVAALARVGGAK